VTSIKVFTHHQCSAKINQNYVVRVCGFGFQTGDLFRQLVSVSGIRYRLAMALLDTLSLQELVSAIVSGNARVLLCPELAPGATVKRQRIALELKQKLSEWRNQAGLSGTAEFEVR
jgi:Holliday junction DNA helicase RuvA